MTECWNDFNDAKQNANLIPKGTHRQGAPDHPPRRLR